MKVGDSLYHVRAGVWGQIVGFDPTGPAIFEVNTGDHRSRRILIQDGGKVNGIKMLKWHEPVSVDLPFSDVSRLQHLIDFLIYDLYGDGHEAR